MKFDEVRQGRERRAGRADVESADPTSVLQQCLLHRTVAVNIVHNRPLKSASEPYRYEHRFAVQFIFITRAGRGTNAPYKAVSVSRTGEHFSRTTE